MSHYDYPEDEFDAAEDGSVAPVGVHRAPQPAWRSWVPLLAIIVIVPLLAWGAVAALGSRSGSGSTSAASTTQAAAATTEAAAPATTEAVAAAPTTEAAAAATTTAAATADLTTGITVHNGTSTSGLAAGASSKLSNAGFTHATVSSGIYSQTTPASSTVYYAAEANKATAEKVAQTLGISNVVQSSSQAQSNAIVVILRSDYTA